MSPVSGASYSLNSQVYEPKKDGIPAELINQKVAVVSQLTGAFPAIDYDAETGNTNIVIAGEFYFASKEKKGQVRKSKVVPFVVTLQETDPIIPLEELPKNLFGDNNDVAIATLHIAGYPNAKPLVIFSRDQEGDVQDMFVVDSITCTKEQLKQLREAAQGNIVQYDTAKRSVLPADDDTTVYDIPPRKYFKEARQYPREGFIHFDEKHERLYYGYPVSNRSGEYSAQKSVQTEQTYHDEPKPEKRSWAYFGVSVRTVQLGNRSPSEYIKHIEALRQIVNLLES